MIRKDDSEIKQAVLEKFKWDTRIKETDVGVEMNNGVVTLTGTVSSDAEKMAVQEAAPFVAGVLDVANDIVVKAPGSLGRTDTEIAQAVRHALEWDMRVPHERIRSTVSDGVVNLEGNVNFISALSLKLDWQKYQAPGWPAARPLLQPLYSIPPSNPAGIFGSFSGTSVSVASVSSKTLATETAFSSAIRTTLVGSMIPASIRSTYSPRAASKP